MGHRADCGIRPHRRIAIGRTCPRRQAGRRTRRAFSMDGRRVRFACAEDTRERNARHLDARRRAPDHSRMPMKNRREFLATSLTALGISTLIKPATLFAAPAPKKILILGGTG